MFLAALAFACYRRPIDNLDRYIYEALVRGRTQSIDTVYSIVKTESPRAEASSILDSPQHLRELEPLYSIRPVYLGTIFLLSKIVPFQHAITLVSATALFGTGIIVLLWTKSPLLSGLLLAAYPLVVVGRMGTPDALAMLLIVPALWLLDRQLWAPLVLLFLSLGVRTDNVLLLLAVLAWLAFDRKIPRWLATGLAALALGIVLGLNHWAGNYGWIVLFRFSFVAGRYPAQIPHVLTVGEYLKSFVNGVTFIAAQVAVWVLIGLLAWRRQPNPLLIVVGCAVAAHFLLYPSPEDRYLVWAYVVVGATLIRSLDQGNGLRSATDASSSMFRDQALAES